MQKFLENLFQRGCLRRFFVGGRFPSSDGTLFSMMVFSLLFFSLPSRCTEDICLSLLKSYEKRYQIPENLLVAMAKVESGRFSKEKKTYFLSPWVINVKGQGHYFTSKAKTVAFVKKVKSRGVTNIDVGCLQVNLFHHGKAFDSIEKALEPEVNIAYAAQHLKNLREQYGSWAKAIGHYHSATLAYNGPYKIKVYKMWAFIRREEYTRLALLRKQQNSFYSRRRPRTLAEIHGFQHF